MGFFLDDFILKLGVFFDNFFGRYLNLINLLMFYDKFFFRVDFVIYN